MIPVSHLVLIPGFFQCRLINRYGVTGEANGLVCITVVYYGIMLNYVSGVFYFHSFPLLFYFL